MLLLIWAFLSVTCCRYPNKSLRDRSTVVGKKTLFIGRGLLIKDVVKECLCMVACVGVFECSINRFGWFCFCVLLRISGCLVSSFSLSLSLSYCSSSSSLLSLSLSSSSSSLLSLSLVSSLSLLLSLTLVSSLSLLLSLTLVSSSSCSFVSSLLSGSIFISFFFFFTLIQVFLDERAHQESQ